jgi:hypothetical protein
MPAPEPTRDVSTERKAAYYLGTAFQVVGLLLFLSVFVTGAMHFGDSSQFDAEVKSSAFRAFGGMVVAIVGGMIRKVGARGLAGSGVVLDPERARHEAGVSLSSRPKEVVKIRCRACDKLNEEDSKFCQECGQPL